MYEFLNGGYQVRDMAMTDDRTYFYEVMPGLEYLFYEVERTEGTSVVRRKFQDQSNDMNILAYGGSITVHNQSLYFGGSSEPLIRRYDLSSEEVELVFSRAVIDAL
ncbi:MAG: hypothetical protein U5J95_02820 [Balneolaceae bacterium]|nr:hypothetical protein [Balneolaceae bacterium]